MEFLLPYLPIIIPVLVILVILLMGYVKAPPDQAISSPVCGKTAASSLDRRASASPGAPCFVPDGGGVHPKGLGQPR